MTFKIERKGSRGINYVSNHAELPISKTAESKPRRKSRLRKKKKKSVKRIRKDQSFKSVTKVMDPNIGTRTFLRELP